MLLKSNICGTRNSYSKTDTNATFMRINRNIQVEGSFGVIKHDMEFKRFLCKGKTKVKAECFLLVIL